MDKKTFRLKQTKKHLGLNRQKNIYAQTDKKHEGSNRQKKTFRLIETKNIQAQTDKNIQAQTDRTNFMQCNLINFYLLLSRLIVNYNNLFNKALHLYVRYSWP